MDRSEAEIALLELLDKYNQYESDKLEASIAAGAPRPTGYPFTLVTFYQWLDDRRGTSA